MPAQSNAITLIPTGLTVNTVAYASFTPTGGTGNTGIYQSAVFPFGTVGGNAYGTTASIDLRVRYTDYTTTTSDSAFYQVEADIIWAYDGSTFTIADNTVTLLSSTGTLVGVEPGVVIVSGNTIGSYRLTAGINIDAPSYFISVMGHEYITTTIM